MRRLADVACETVVDIRALAVDDDVTVVSAAALVVVDVPAVVSNGSGVVVTTVVVVGESGAETVAFRIGLFSAMIPLIFDVLGHW